MTKPLRAVIALTAPLAASAMLAGCMSSPTYGTDKTANAQLLSDISGALSLAPKRSKVSEYKPRPELVKPATTVVLPDPQEDITRTASAAWPESPEQRRARLRAEATENQGNARYDSPIVDDTAVLLAEKKAEQERIAAMSPEEKAAELERRKIENKQGSDTTRKYLSEPPLQYRVPSETAPVGELGEDEKKKERRLKRMARKKGDGGWRDLVPWL